MSVTKFWMVKGSGPCCVKHSTPEDAESEAVRLARKHPGQHFFVLEAISAHRKVDVESVALSDPEDDLQIPF